MLDGDAAADLHAVPSVCMAPTHTRRASMHSTSGTATHPPRRQAVNTQRCTVTQ